MKLLTFEDLPEQVRESLELLHIPGKDDNEVIEVLLQITTTYPGFIPARLNLAAFQLEAGEIDGSEHTYQNVLNDFPEDNRAIGGLATVHASRKDFKRAEQLAQQAIDNGYDWAPLYEVIADAREATGDLKAASDAFLECYRRSPHSWNCLEQYCRLNNRSFVSPMNPMENPTDEDTLKTLFEYIDQAAHTPMENGDIPGCDHTFRFTEQWAKKYDIDIIDLYQFLNSYGGFCDCEVCFNVESAFFESEEP